jgi:hypothetical protein
MMQGKLCRQAIVRRVKEAAIWSENGSDYFSLIR